VEFTDGIALVLIYTHQFATPPPIYILEYVGGGTLKLLGDTDDVNIWGGNVRASMKMLVVLAGAGKETELE
jgi:hypothetical protein